MKAADRQLIQDYPLAVRFPQLTGRHFMLVWWTHQEQHHMTLAKSEAQMVQLYRTMLESGRSPQDEAEPKRFFQIDIVAPPELLVLKHARQARKYEIDSFARWVGNAVEDLLEKPSVTKADRKEILGHLSSLHTHIASNMPFLVKQFDERMEKIVVDAKTEVESFLLNTARKLGQQALAEKAPQLLLGQGKKEE